MVLSANKGNSKTIAGTVDDRLVCLADIMPTLLDLCDIDVPKSVDGISAVNSEKRTLLYGEVGEDNHATRMIRDQRYKLIYYPVGNHLQLFDLKNDPDELSDIAHTPAHAETRTRLGDALVAKLYGTDLDWISNGKLTGKPDRRYSWAPHRSLNSQRGDGWPPSPKVEIPQIEWSNERQPEEPGNTT